MNLGHYNPTYIYFKINTYISIMRLTDYFYQIQLAKGKLFIKELVLDNIIQNHII